MATAAAPSDGTPAAPATVTTSSTLADKGPEPLRVSSSRLGDSAVYVPATAPASGVTLVAPGGDVPSSLWATTLTACGWWAVRESTTTLRAAAGRTTAGREATWTVHPVITRPPSLSGAA